MKSNMAADKRKSQPGKLPIMILEILRNILIPVASFYPECLADLIFRHKFGFCPLTKIEITGQKYNGLPYYIGRP